MTLLDRLERHLARFAIPGLIRYVVMLNALVYLLQLVTPDYLSYLTLDRAAIAHGQVWRLVSWIFIPASASPLFMLIYLMSTWWLGDILEATWGTFRMNAYYLLGMAGCIASALIFGISGENVMLNLTLLLATATVAPNLQVLFFFVIPVKLKWIAMIAMVFPMLSLLFGDMATRAVTILCLANYVIFFGPKLIREARQNRQTQQRRARFEAAKLPVEQTLHRCAVCGLTEVADPDADFRVASDGREYCMSHLPVAQKQ